MTTAAAVLVVLAGWAEVYSYMLLAGRRVHYGFEITNANIGLGFAATALTALF